MESICDVMILVNQEHMFHLNSSFLYRCGSMVKLFRKCEEVKESDTEESWLLRSPGMYISLENVPGGAETFEFALRFCYSNGDLVISSANVARLWCVAEMLEMTEQYGRLNLLRRTESFLKNAVFLSWHESMTVLRSCQQLLPFPESSPLVQRCVESLAQMVQTPPAECSGNSSGPDCDAAFEPHRLSTDSNDGRFGTSRSLPKKYWWFQELCAVPVCLVEKIVRTLMASGMEHKVLSRFLLHYVHQMLPILGHNCVSLVVPYSGALHPLPNFEEAVSLVDCFQAPRDVLEIVVALLATLETGASPCRALFGLCKIAFILDGSDDCKRQLEKMIGISLGMVTLDDILVPSLPSRSCAPLYDVELVLRLVNFFLEDQQILLEKTMAAAAKKKHENGIFSWLCDHKSHVKALDGPCSILMTLLKVGDLLDKYLSEIAADVYLKPLTFQALAEALPDCARCSHDGLYRAVDIYLEAHPIITESEEARLCDILNYQKLSLEACKHLTRNKTFPPWVSMQVLLEQQMQLKAAVRSSYDKRKKKSPRSTVVGWFHQSKKQIADAAGDGEEKMDCETYQKDLQAIEFNIPAAENLCKKMRSELVRHSRTKREGICQ